MNTPTPTPRTDSAWAKTFEDDENQCRAGNAASDMRDACATLERELAALTAEREKSERYRLATLKLDAELAAANERLRSEAMDDYASIKDLQRELATERARLDWVFRNCKVMADDYTTGHRDVYAIHDREDLGAAMKEDAK